MRVIARAYRGRPLDRVTVGRQGRVVFVADASVSDAIRNTIGDGIGFPAKYVFEFNAELYESLSGAWEAGDLGKLEELWSRATLVEIEALEAA
jgi:hypothetical protein